MTHSWFALALFVLFVGAPSEVAAQRRGCCPKASGTATSCARTQVGATTRPGNRQGRRWAQPADVSTLRPGRGAGRGPGGPARRGRRGMPADTSTASGSPTAPCLLQGRTSHEVSPAYLELLQEALVFEVAARDFYTAAHDALGVRRHANLARAEQNHIRAVTALIEYLGGEAKLPQGGVEPGPDTLADADARCRAIEEKAIELYRALIADCPDPAALPVLQNVQAANKRHLAAVSR